MLLSIVIANYNYGRFLEEALQSILRQCVEWPKIEAGLGGGKPAEPIRTLTLPTGDAIEVIICDAASTDNSVAIIEKYSVLLAGHHFSGPAPIPNPSSLIPSPHLTPNPYSLIPSSPPPLVPNPSSLIPSPFSWCSEKDGGQSAAFNKGFSRARGRFLSWLNADDLSVEGSLRTFARSARRHPDCEWFTGNFYRFLQSNGKVIQIGWGPHWYPRFLQCKHSPIVVFGPTSFFSKKIYEQVGRIDETLHFCMDTDLWIRFMTAGIKQVRVKHFCWAFRMHQESKTAEYNGHELPCEVAKRFRVEADGMLAKTNYRCAWESMALFRLLRVLDGSILVLLIMKFGKICHLSMRCGEEGRR